MRINLSSENLSRASGSPIHHLNMIKFKIFNFNVMIKLPLADHGFKFGMNSHDKVLSEGRNESQIHKINEIIQLPIITDEMNMFPFTL